MSELDKGLVEDVAAAIHGVYQEEAHRQGDARHHDKYADLPDNIKEFDRVLARYILTKEAEWKKEIDRLKAELADKDDIIADLKRFQALNETAKDIRIDELEAEVAMRETNSEAKLRLSEVEVSDLKYHIRELTTGIAKRPWRWVKKFQMGHRRNHWCLESVPEPDNGSGDGHDRTVGIILTDYWSQHPTPLMLFVQDELNRSSERQQQLAAKDKQIKALREAANRLSNEVSGCIGIAGDEILQAVGNTNYRILCDRLTEARAALKKLEEQ